MSKLYMLFFCNCILFMSKAAKFIDMERFFRALADRTRLRLLNLMSNGEVCVCFFVEVLGMSQPKISRHLGYLRRAGVVASRREGKWIHYRIIEPSNAQTAQVFDCICTWLLEDDEMKRDLRHLETVCCAQETPVQLQGAPRPRFVAGGAT